MTDGSAAEDKERMTKIRTTMVIVARGRERKRNAPKAQRVQERAIQECCRGQRRGEEDMAENSHDQGAKGARKGYTDTR